MAQAGYEDTPEIAMTRAWRMGENARRVIDQSQQALSAAIARRASAGELRALVLNQEKALRLLLDEAKWAAHVAIYGAPSDAAA